MFSILFWALDSQRLNILACQHWICKADTLLSSIWCLTIFVESTRQGNREKVKQSLPFRLGQWQPFLQLAQDSWVLEKHRVASEPESSSNIWTHWECHVNCMIYEMYLPYFVKTESFSCSHCQPTAARSWAGGLHCVWSWRHVEEIGVWAYLTYSLLGYVRVWAGTLQSGIDLPDCCGGHFRKLQIDRRTRASSPLEFLHDPFMYLVIFRHRDKSGGGVFPVNCIKHGIL